MTVSRESSSAAGRSLVAFAVLLAVYIATAAAGLQWATFSGAASSIWPAAGIGLAGLLIGGKRLWPAIAVGLVLATLIVGSPTPWWTAVSFGVVNALATLVAALVIERFSSRAFGQLATISDVLLLLGAAALAAAISAAGGTITLLLAGAAELPSLPRVAQLWFFADLVGIMAVTPLITTARTSEPGRLTSAGMVHLAAALLTCLVVSWFIFFGPQTSRAWMIFPVLVWVALAFRVQGASLAVVTLVAVASTGTMLGYGPFTPAANDGAQIVLLQQFLAIAAATVLLLAAAVDERQAESRLRELADRELNARGLVASAEERLQLAMQASATGMWTWDIAENRVEWSDECYLIHGLAPGDFAGTSEAFDAMLHPGDRPRVWSTLEQCLRDQSDLNMEFRIVRPTGDVRWVANHGRGVYGSDGKPLRVIGTIKDVTDRHVADDDRARLVRRAEIAQRAAKSSLYEYDIGSNRAVRDPFIRELAGYDEAELADTQESWEALMPEDDRAEFRDTVERALAGSERFAMEYRIRSKSNDMLWLSDVGQIIRRSDGSAERIIGLVTDITERKSAEEREQLLAREVDHRAKNLLTVVQSVLQMTRADDVTQFREAVTGRIQSLARAHSLLAEARWEGLELTQLVRDELAAFATDEGGRVIVKGPPLRLTPAAGQSLALVLHELATNAAKYGSLSRPGGQVELGWHVDDAPSGCLHLRWKESGGAATHAPTRSGFGSRLIRASVERQLGGDLAYQWDDDGLTVELSLPSRHFRQR